MNAGEVVKLLKEKGMVRSEATVKYLAAKYKLYNDVDSPRPGLNPKKIKKLIKVLSSSHRVAEIARSSGVSYSKVNYYILKYRIPTIKEFGVMLIRSKKDVEYVKSLL